MNIGPDVRSISCLTLQPDEPQKEGAGVADVFDSKGERGRQVRTSENRFLSTRGLFEPRQSKLRHYDIRVCRLQERTKPSFVENLAVNKPGYGKTGKESRSSDEGRGPVSWLDAVKSTCAQGGEAIDGELGRERMQTGAYKHIDLMPSVT